ncbi:hypothetical protein SARC_07852 [Sphaeroforma arctica JP610]|uniref:Cyclin-like domain-containing protein n=1 Tax=Sphaeroforma arctica JP610 TaxID=667725 RepID=A0A0L0FSK7_9EUKA|nr:hypothetical protein, variant [Sphaeroforma arctica JP610]XP_014153663.1 hypothetical protein SARC_07852 [Sphaeroforma arctica JP610]KNC79760.1 hypothetical protein, variant [Sphaeroforma arctica JP610]KNC79761.1 hypothetical protein SARC_07852 [Sphaeroforma arctica JP610]|eukprot:XP_014153662.1 hypothetical protein, variant [Sphaeroforma arctica JP610]
MLPAADESVLPPRASRWSADRWLVLLLEALAQEQSHVINGAGYRHADRCDLVNEEDRMKACAELFKLQVGYHLSKETFFLALTYLDRFLSVRRVLSKHFRLVLFTCFMLAAKMQEESNRLPMALDLARACSPNVRVSDLKRMELKILIGLNWEMSSASSLSFLYKYLEFLRNTNALSETEIALVLDLGTKELFKYSAYTDKSGSQAAYIALTVAIGASDELRGRASLLDRLSDLDVMLGEHTLPARLRDQGTELSDHPHCKGNSSIDEGVSSGAFWPEDAMLQDLDMAATTTYEDLVDSDLDLDVHANSDMDFKLEASASPTPASRTLSSFSAPPTLNFWNPATTKTTCMRPNVCNTNVCTDAGVGMGNVGCGSTGTVAGGLGIVGGGNGTVSGGIAKPDRKRVSYLAAVLGRSNKRVSSGGSGRKIRMVTHCTTPTACV